MTTENLDVSTIVRRRRLAAARLRSVIEVVSTTSVFYGRVEHRRDDSDLYGIRHINRLRSGVRPGEPPRYRDDRGLGLMSAMRRLLVTVKKCRVTHCPPMRSMAMTPPNRKHCPLPKPDYHQNLLLSFGVNVPYFL